MPEEAEVNLIRNVCHRIVVEVDSIKAGKSYESEQKLRNYVDVLWSDMESINSSTTFELVDHFRIASYVAQMHGKEPDACELLLLLHQLMAEKMRNSKHRDFMS